MPLDRPLNYFLHLQGIRTYTDTLVRRTEAGVKVLEIWFLLFLAPFIIHYYNSP